MHPLKSAVLHHKLDEISDLAIECRAEGTSPTPGELLKIAMEMGNKSTVTRLARHFPEHSTMVNYREILTERIRDMACNYFGGGSPDKAARRLWAQVVTGTIEPFSKDEPDFVLTPALIEDMRFLFNQVGVQSKAQLQQLVAGPVGPN